MNINGKITRFAVSIIALILLAGCQDMFTQHDDDKVLLNTVVDAIELYDNEWYTGKIASSDEADQYIFRITDGGRYWIEWADAQIESGLISKIKVAARYNNEDVQEDVFERQREITSEDWPQEKLEQEEEHRYRFWAFSSGNIVVDVRGIDANASGAYRIRCHKATETEQLEIEGYRPLTAVAAGMTVLLQWSAPANQVCQGIYRKACSEYSDKFEYYADIWDLSDDLPARNYEYVDYFAEPGTKYIYYVEGFGTLNEDLNFFPPSTFTQNSKAIPGPGVKWNEPFEGSSHVTFDPATGDLTFDPPLSFIKDHVNAGDGWIGIDVNVGQSMVNFWFYPEYDGAVLSKTNMFDCLSSANIENCQKGDFWIEVYPMYGRTVEKYNLEYDFYIPASYTLTGDMENLRLPLYRAVSDVQARAILSTEIEIWWKELELDTKYEIYRATGDGAFSMVGRTDHSAAYTEDEDEAIVFYSDDTVAEGITYRYKIVAVYPNGGRSGDSAIVTVSTPGTVPAVPELVAVSLNASLPSTSLDISWNPVSGATSYYVWRSTSPDGPYDEDATEGSVSGTVFTDTGLSQLTTYYYKVEAENGAGYSGKSEYKFAKTGDLSSGADVWYEDSLTEGSAVNKYTFNATVGTTYRIRWDDNYQGTSAYMCDLEVKVSGCGAEDTWLKWVDSGYSDICAFTATSSGEVTIEARPYNAGDYNVGDYRVQWSEY
jgi:hypothetical protein